MLNVFQPTLGPEEIAAATRVIERNWLGRGPEVAAFEAEFAAHLGVAAERIVATTTCTEALFQVLEAYGIGPGDEVVLPSISFVGAGNAIAAQGARPVFCEADPRTLNPSPADIAARISPRTKAIIILHYGGVAHHLAEIADLAKRHGIKLIEDAACSVATRIDGRAAGTFGDVGVWSFDAMKVLVTGDGAMIQTDDADLMRRLRSRIILGMETESGFTTKSTKLWWKIDISSFGRRVIMNDLTAAIGREQLKKLPGFVARRRALSQRYDAALADIAWIERPPPVPAGVLSTHYMYWVQCDPARRDDLATHLKNRDIYCTFRYWPLHRIPLYGHQGALPDSDRAADITLNLPLHQAMSEADVDRVAAEIRAFG